MISYKKLFDDPEKLKAVLEQYEKDLEGVNELVTLRGKNLERANRENPQWLHYYLTRRADIGSLLKYAKRRVEQVHSQLFRVYTETYNRELSDRAKDKYILGDKKYIEATEPLLMIEEVYEQYDSAIKSFDAVGYALNNITKIRISSLEDVVL